MHHNGRGATASRPKNRTSGSAQRRTKQIRKKNFLCPHCKKWCTRPCELAEHIAMHNGDKQHACPCGYRTSYRSNLTRHQHRCKSLSSPIFSPSPRPPSPSTKCTSSGLWVGPVETFSGSSSINAPNGSHIRADMGSLPTSLFGFLRPSILSEDALRGEFNPSNNTSGSPRPIPQVLIVPAASGRSIEEPSIQKELSEASFLSNHTFNRSGRFIPHDRPGRLAFSPDGILNPAFMAFHSPPICDRPFGPFATPWGACFDRHTTPHVSVIGSKHYPTPEVPITRRGAVVELAQVPHPTAFSTWECARENRTNRSAPSINPNLDIASRPASSATGYASIHSHRESGKLQI